MDAGFFKGTSTDQDKRFSDKEAKLLKSMKFPPEFDVKVDMRKVNLQVMRPWVVKKVVELVGFEDEVVVEYAMGLLEDPSKPTPDPKLIQINLTGFLTSSTPEFMQSLWTLLIEAQNSDVGVPKSFVEEKKEEMRTAKSNFNQQRTIAGAAGRPHDDGRPSLDDIRDRERRERADRGGGRGRGRGARRFDDGPPERNMSARGSSNGNYLQRRSDSGWGVKRNTAKRPSRSRSRSIPRQSPPRRVVNRSRSRSRSITPPQRAQVSRRRSPYSPPTITPPGTGGRRRYSASPSPQRVKSPSRSPSPPPTGRTFRSISRSPSAPRDSYTQRRGKLPSRSPSPSRHRQSPIYSPPHRSYRTQDRRRSYSRSRSPRPVPNRRRRSYTRSPTPSLPPSPRGEKISRSRKRRRTSRSYSRGRSYSPRRYDSRTPEPDRARRRTDEEEFGQEAPLHSELKIKGSANASSSRTAQNANKHKPLATRLAEKEAANAKNGLTLQQKERELKEAALRNKLVKSKARKNSMTEEE